jgi:hypothetical protein
VPDHVETEMAQKTFDDLPIDEQEDFRKACLDAGLAPDAFTVSYTEDVVGADDIKVLEREVMVSFGNITRGYDGGDGTRWTVDFEDDVRAHVFV